MPTGEIRAVVGAVRWEALALWFGRGLFLLALYMGQQLLAKVDALVAAQTVQTQALADLSREMHSRTALRWTQVDQRLWATLLAQKNPAIIVPEPHHVELPGDAPR